MSRDKYRREADTWLCVTAGAALIWLALRLIRTQIDMGTRLYTEIDSLVTGVHVSYWVALAVCIYCWLCSRPWRA
jgi:hypothetical protein